MAVVSYDYGTLKDVLVQERGPFSDYLRRLWEETDGERQSQAKGGETHQAVDRQDESLLSLQQRKPAGKDSRAGDAVEHINILHSRCSEAASNQTEPH